MQPNANKSLGDLYIAYNPHPVSMMVTVPDAPADMIWYVLMHPGLTSATSSFNGNSNGDSISRRLGDGNGGGGGGVCRLRIADTSLPFPDNFLVEGQPLQIEVDASRSFPSIPMIVVR